MANISPTFEQACLGNIPAAETHLNGVMAILNSREQRKDIWDGPSYIELELTNRYLLLSVSLKAKFDGIH